MAFNGRGIEVIHLDEFAGLLGYSSWFDPLMYRKHGAFISEFQEGEWLPRDISEHYISRQGLGDPLSSKVDSETKPDSCCQTGNRAFCLRIVKRRKLIGIIERLSKVINPVPEVLIWHDLFLQIKKCDLQNHLEYEYYLFELIQNGSITKTIDLDGKKLYEINQKPTKRGPGRPRKY